MLYKNNNKVDYLTCFYFHDYTQQTFTCLKSTVQTPEKDVKYVQSLKKTPEWHL